MGKESFYYKAHFNFMYLSVFSSVVFAVLAVMSTSFYARVNESIARNEPMLSYVHTAEATTVDGRHVLMAVLFLVSALFNWWRCREIAKRSTRTSLEVADQKDELNG